jgi:hypothetical protein
MSTYALLHGLPYIYGLVALLDSTIMLLSLTFNTESIEEPNHHARNKPMVAPNLLHIYPVNSKITLVR